jgi:type IV pilus assembly protein PilY1
MVKSFLLKTAAISSVILSLGAAITPVSAQMSQSPMVVRQPAPPLVLLTVGRDEKLFNAAYNDYSDVDGDGSIDISYKPGVITYYGMFDSNKCYEYDAGNGYFRARSAVTNARFKTCNGRWSGDFLNYLTTSRADALRVVFYGGKRSVDSATETVLERAYIPQDAHAWGKEYGAFTNSYNGKLRTAEANTQFTYDISRYTPYAQPAANTRHFFGNVTPNSGATVGTPRLRVMLNRPERIWNWTAVEGPILGTGIEPDTGPRISVALNDDLVVRVRVCENGNGLPLEENCKGYPLVNPTVWKPTGILHDYGETRDVAFALLTGSYEKPRSGGVLRSEMDYFDKEIDPATGQFRTSITKIVRNLDAIRISGWSGSAGGGGNYNCTGIACRDYGSPIAEMMYEGLRYLAGATAPTPAFDYTAPGIDGGLGLTKISTWNPPFRGPQNGGFPACSKPVQMVVSDVTPTFDSDELPGSAFGGITASPAALAGLNVAGAGSNIWTAEGLTSANFFIGHSLANTGNQYDQSPTPKLVNSFGNIRGLAPAETTRQGSYYAGSVAKFGAENIIIPDPKDPQKVETYAIALTPSLPTIKIPMGNNSVSVIPFGKSVGGCNFGEFVAGTTFLTNRIVGFNFMLGANIPGFPTNATVNSGRPYVKFTVSFEDNEQGTDNDMDAIIEYEVFAVNATQVRVTMRSVRSAGCIDQSVGYVISGTDSGDGAHLGVRDVGGGNNTFVLHDPFPFTFNGTVAAPVAPPAGTLGLLYSRTFDVTGAQSVNGSVPHDPLWYAAKYGVPIKPPATAPVPDANGDGVPDNYALVTDPARLRAQISAALDKILENTSTSLAVGTSGGIVRAQSQAFRASYKYGRAVIPRDTGTPISANVWTGAMEARRLDRDGRLTTTDWVTSPASIAAAKNRTILTRISSSQYRDLVPAELANSASLESLLAPGALQSVLQPKLEVINGGPLSPAQLKRKTGEALIAYLRGDQSLERGNNGTTGSSGVLRPRESALGDIVHSTPVYQGAQDYGYGGTDMEGAGSYSSFVGNKSSRRVWVGANDGMLHAFDAATGELKFSFIPAAVQGELWRLASPGYTHRYYVNGQISIGDVYTPSGWRTVLVAALGAGGRSVIALDVTGPNPSVLWELEGVNDLGHVLGDIRIVRLPNVQSNKPGWAVIFGNGYETTVPSGASTKNVAKLFVVNPMTGSALSPNSLTVPDSVAYNGMGSPAVSIENNLVSNVWVGDLGGYLWKFDLARSPSNWTLAFTGDKPLFRAVRNNVPQPITSAPSVARSTSRGYYVTFGTGKFFQDADRLNTQVQSLYSIRDRTNSLQAPRGGVASPSARFDLIRDNLTSYAISAEASGNRRIQATGTLNADGWYLDLVSPGNNPVGERLLASPQIFFPDVYFGTFSVSQDVCDEGSDGWFMGVPVDPSTDASAINIAEAFADRTIAGIQLNRGIESSFGPIATRGGSAVSYLGVLSDADVANTSVGSPSKKLQPIRTKVGRQNWRQVQ